MIQRMLAIWSLVPVPFLNPAWTSGTVNTVHSSWWLAIEPSQPLLPLLLLPSIFSKIRVFSNELALHIRWANYWSFSSVSVLPVNIQGWFPLGLTNLISLQSKGLSECSLELLFKGGIDLSIHFWGEAKTNKNQKTIDTWASLPKLGCTRTSAYILRTVNLKSVCLCLSVYLW